MPSLHRRRFLAGLSATATALLAAGQAWAQSTFGSSRRPTRFPPKSFENGGRKMTLLDQLKFGLKARRDAEIKYLENVVKLVNQKKLPQKLVLDTFHYARKRTLEKRRRQHAAEGYEFQYFQRALKLRAAKLGVKLTLVPLPRSGRFVGRV